MNRRLTALALIFTLMLTAIAAGTTTATAAAAPPVTEEVYDTEFNRTVCYGGVDVRATLGGAIEAGIVEPASAEGNYQLVQAWTSWGPCLENGQPINLDRLSFGAPSQYITACDDFDSIGGMRVSRSVVDGVVDTGVAYLVYPLQFDPCASQSMVNEPLAPAGHIVSCAYGSIIVRNAPGPNQYEWSVPVYRCDPSGMF